MRKNNRKVRGFYPVSRLSKRKSNFRCLHKLDNAFQVINGIPIWLSGIGGFGVFVIAIWLAFWSPLPDALEGQLRQQVASLERERDGLQDDIRELAATRTNVSDQIRALEIEHELELERAQDEITAALQNRDRLNEEIAILTLASDEAWEVAVRVHAYSSLSDEQPWNWSPAVSQQSVRLERAVREWRSVASERDDFDERQATMRILGHMWDSMQTFVLTDVSQREFSSSLEANLEQRSRMLLRERFEAHCPVRWQWIGEVTDQIETRTEIPRLRNLRSRGEVTNTDSEDTPPGLISTSNLLWSMRSNGDFIDWIENVSWKCFSGIDPADRYSAFGLDGVFGIQDWLGTFSADTGID